ncbi:hypothetical protein J6X15_02520 [Candidatus Saccharibacteria bacterium]|nr:hypothetical protein [Candidatus Saccharibacteria bacterium]
MRDRNNSPLQEIFHNKYILAFLIIDIIAIVALVGIFVNRATKVSSINFNVTPVDATISVNGDKHYSNGQYDIAPGTYKVVISHDGLDTKTMTVDIGARDYANVTVFLADADHNFDYYKLQNSYESYRKLKAIASAENNITTDKDASAQDFIADFERAMSIVDELPIKGYVYSEPSANMSTGGFTIENGLYKKQCTQSACLIVRYYGKDYEKEVLKQIKQAGYNPDDYQLVYERYAK